MSHEFCIQFGPCFTNDRFNDAKWATLGRLMYGNRDGALKFLPSKTSIPLFVDHKKDEPAIGAVTALHRLDCGGPWWCASGTADDPPSWLKRGAAASFGFIPLHSSEVQIREHRAEVVYEAVVTEVSALSPSVKPAEPLARVLWCKPARAPKRTAVRRSRPSVDDDVDELNRRIEWIERRTRRRVDPEIIVMNMQDELMGGRPLHKLGAR